MKRFYLTISLLLIVSSLVFATNDDYNSYSSKSGTSVGVDSATAKNKFKVSPNKSASAPKWVKTFPKDDKYFTGIGSSAYTGNLNDDTLKALSSALTMIASQIETKISSVTQMQESSLTKTSNGNTTEAYKEQFNSQVNSSVKMTLDGVELVDSWYNEKKGVHVYCRLSIAKYNELRQKRLTNVNDIAKNNFGKAMDSFAKQDWKQSFILFSTIAAAVFPFPDEVITVSYNGQSFNAASESWSRLRQMTAGLSYQPQNTQTQNMKNTFGGFTYKLSINNTPIEGMPVYSISSAGKSTSATDNRGEWVISTEIIQRDSEKLFLGIDIESICKSNMLDTSDYIAIEKALWSVRNITVRKTGIQIYISADESLESCVNALSEYLTDKYNARILDNADDALFILTLSDNTKMFPQNSGKFRVAEGSLTLALRHNIAKSKNIISLTFDKEKENGMNENQAISNVREAFADGIGDAYKERLDTAFDELNISTFTLEE